MFGRRAIKMTFVKEPKPVSEKFLPIEEGGKIDQNMIENATRFGKDFVTHAAATAVVAYSAMRVIDTVCKIAVITARAKLN